MSDIGSFGALFDLHQYGIQEPVLVSGTDGVGTKLKIAFMLDRHDTIGIDAVAMCVNDILAQGAMPLFFLDYLALGKNVPSKVEQIVKGVADGCVQAGCALIGGETAEMPDMYSEGEYDIAGFAVGVAEKSKLLSPTNVNVGDIVIGLPSSGLHSNGYSLVRKILFKDHQVDLQKRVGDKSLAECLIEPTKIYVKAVLPLIQQALVSGIAHITGGGFYENMPRCIQKNQGLRLKKGTWTVPAIFNTLQELGNIAEDELYHVFNMGIGMILVVKPDHVNQVMDHFKNINETAIIMGEISNEVGIQWL
jgi:phosphoribosylformylglycinamidine cyclo-ligase